MSVPSDANSSQGYILESDKFLNLEADTYTDNGIPRRGIVSGQLTGAQVYTLFSQPVQILPAPGAGTFYRLGGVTWQWSPGVTPAGGGAAGDIDLTMVFPPVGYGAVLHSADITAVPSQGKRLTQGQSGYADCNLETGIWGPGFGNRGVYIYKNTGDFTGAVPDGVLTYWVEYNILNYVGGP